MQIESGGSRGHLGAAHIFFSKNSSSNVSVVCNNEARVVIGQDKLTGLLGVLGRFI